MGWPRITITETAVETPRDSYKLDHITVVSVRRPLLPVGIMALLCGGAFTWRFHDLLYAHEITALKLGIGVLVLLGVFLGRLQLLSRDLRGSELAGAAFGFYPHLNQVRRQIMRAVEAQKSGMLS